MKISIIIPTYNSEKTIKMCLKSLINQTELPNEILVIDGASKDKTKEICKKFKNPLIKFVTNPKKQTTGSNRNLGAKIALSENLVFLDSDCIADKNLVKHYKKAFKKYSCIAGNVKPYNKKKVAQLIYIIEYLFLKKNLKRNRVIGPFFWVMNFGIKKKNFIKFPDETYSEDIVFIVKIMKKEKKIVFMKEIFVRHKYSETLIEFCKKRIKQIGGSLKMKVNLEILKEEEENSQFNITLSLNKMSVKELRKRIRKFKKIKSEEITDKDFYRATYLCCLLGVLSYKSPKEDYLKILKRKLSL